MESLTSLIAELGIQDRVTLLGFVADDDIPDYFEVCDMFCLSSIWKTEALQLCKLKLCLVGSLLYVRTYGSRSSG